jgi:hypothetical protein
MKFDRENAKIRIFLPATMLSGVKFKDDVNDNCKRYDFHAGSKWRDLRDRQ